jgi:hypothetical protein
MDGKPAGETPPQDPGGENPGSVARTDDSPEQFGPMELVRQLKDDGRALLVFQRAERR